MSSHRSFNKMWRSQSHDDFQQSSPKKSTISSTTAATTTATTPASSSREQLSIPLKPMETARNCSISSGGGSTANPTPVNTVHPMRKISNIKNAGQSIFRAGKRYLQKFPSFDVDDGIDNVDADKSVDEEKRDNVTRTRRHSLTSSRLETVESLEVENIILERKKSIEVQENEKKNEDEPEIQAGER